MVSFAVGGLRAGGSSLKVGLGCFLGTSVLLSALSLSAATGQKHMRKPHSGAPRGYGTDRTCFPWNSSIVPGAELGLAAGYGFPRPCSLRQFLEAANFPGLVWEVVVGLLGPVTWSTW